MTTESESVSSQWVDLGASVTFTDGQTYVVQNNGSRVVFLNEQASIPNAADEGHKLFDGQTWSFTKRSGLNLYARTLRDTSRIYVTEST